MYNQIGFTFKVQGCKTKNYLSDERSLSLLSVIDALSRKTVIAYDTPEGGYFILSQLLSHWQIGLNQVVRFETKAFTRSEVPFNSPDYRDREMFGLYLHKKAELCYGIFDAMAMLDKDITLQYGNFSELWLQVVEEERRGEIAKPIFDRQEDISRRMEEVKCLKKYINPYTLLNACEWKHNFNLIEAAISIAQPRKKGNKDIRQRREVFACNYWNPYIEALQRSTQELRKFGFAMVDRERGSAYSNQKRVQGQPARKTLYPRPTPIQKLCQRGIKP